MLLFYRLLFTIVIITSVFITNAQQRYCESFNTNLSEAWSNINDWVMVADGINNQASLKHDLKDVKGTSEIIYTPSFDFNTIENDLLVRFSIQNGNWDPSSSNNFHLRIGSENGLVVGVNAKGSSDLVSIWPIQDGKIGSSIAETSVDWDKNTFGQISLNIAQSGMLRLTVDTNNNRDTVQCSCDIESIMIDQFSFLFEFTKTRAGELLIDDFCIEAINSPPHIESIQQVDNRKFMITFSEAVKQHSVHIDNISVTSDENIPVEIESIAWIDQRKLELTTKQNMNGAFICKLKNFMDIDGVQCDASSCDFEMKQTIVAGDLSIHEILFNPFPDGEDFIELKNSSSEEIFLENLQLVSIDDMDTTYSTAPELMEIYLQPNELIALSKNRSQLLTSYQCCNESVIEVSKLPKMDNSDGHIAILDHLGTIIDEVIYSESMHDLMISDNEGISLELIDSLWYSASEKSGGATPGCRNSQQTVNHSDIQIQLSSKFISPNFDDVNDELEIRIITPEPGYITNINLYTALGVHALNIENNTLISAKEVISFDGLNKDNKPLPFGNYIITIDLHHHKGDQYQSKHLLHITDSKKK